MKALSKGDVLALMLAGWKIERDRIGSWLTLGNQWRVIEESVMHELHHGGLIEFGDDGEYRISKLGNYYVTEAHDIDLTYDELHDKEKTIDDMSLRSFCSMFAIALLLLYGFLVLMLLGGFKQ